MKKRNGFTLVELIISMGIMSILVTVLANLFGTTLLMRQKSEAISAIAQDSRFVIQRLAYDIGRASSITSPSPGNSASSMTITIGAINYTYSLSSGALNLSIGGSAPVALTSAGSTISNLNFYRNNDLGSESSVTVDINFVPVSVQTGIQNQSRRVVTTFVTN